MPCGLLSAWHCTLILKFMKHYYYACSDCGKTYSPEKIESELIYLCPECGKAEKNMPLKGVLSVLYDFKSLKKILTKNVFLNFSEGKYWQYPQLFPLEYSAKNFSLKGISEDKLNNIRTNAAPVTRCVYKNEQVMIFDDTRNPTLSYKDRASSLVALKALQMGITEISAASTGNAGSSLAGICARLGIKSHIFVPEKIPAGKRIQIQSFGAQIYLVKSDYDGVFDLCLEVSNAKGWYNRNTAYNPLTVEGKKTSAYDMYIALKGNMPDYIFVSVGDGVIISGIYKGLFELKELGLIKKLPHLIGVQAKGSDALVRYMKDEKFKYKPASTLADSISAGAPRNLYMAHRSVVNTQGSVIAVSDKEILDAQKQSARSFGYLIEPAASAAFAGFIKMKKEKNIPEGAKSMLMFTGNGLKDSSALSEWNKEIKPLSSEEWKKLLKIK